MEVLTRLVNQSPTWTISDLKIGGAHVCYTLQDGAVGGGVNGKGRIPAGRYRVVFHPTSSKNSEYARRFPGLHKGMLLLQHVPGYAGILIHMGVRPQHTLGCLLVGTSFDGSAGELIGSEGAYRELYRILSSALLLGEEVWITIQY